MVRPPWHRLPVPELYRLYPLVVTAAAAQWSSTAWTGDPGLECYSWTIKCSVISKSFQKLIDPNGAKSQFVCLEKHNFYNACKSLSFLTSVILF